MIVPVKKIRVIASKDEKSNLVQIVQELGKIMLSNPVDTQITGEEQQTLKKIEKYISILEPYQKKKFFEYNELSSDEFQFISSDSKVLLEKVENAYESKEIAEKNIEKNNEEINLINPFLDLEVTTNDLYNLNKTKAIIGFYENIKKDSINKRLNKNDCFVETIKEDEDLTYIVAIVSNENYLNVLKELQKDSFKEVILPKVDVSLKDYLKELENNLKANNDIINSNELLLKEYSNNINILKAYYDYKYNKAIKDKVKLFETDKTVYFEGWVREDQLEEVEIELNEKVDSNIELLDVDEDEVVPTYTKNNKFVSNFETITNMFSVPNPNELDPNPIMSFWYWLIFGIMMGDVGYGLVMVIFFSLFNKLKKPKGDFKKLINVFKYSGISSIIFGVLLGSFFGASFDLLNMIGKLFGNDQLTSVIFDPINDPLPMLVLSIAIGVVHIISGLILKIINEIRRKEVITALSDGLSWIIILVGIALFVLVKPTLIGIITVLIGALMLIITKALSGSGFVGKILAGSGSIMEVSNYLGDILSYSRILALSLSTAVIAFTFNLLADMVSGSIIGFLLAIIIYIIGHVFNFAMGLLSAYVHDGRLQYLEFYGKFYEGGGTLFEPFTYELKYINEINNKDKEII